jgi:hypothetical protein
MAKVETVKSARKDYPDEGIKKGDTYYKWSFNFGGTYRSKTYPKPSQLTMSPFHSEYYSIGEDLEDDLNLASSAEDLQSAVENAIGRIEDLSSTTEDSLNNMPEQLQESDTGQMLQERIDGLQDWMGNLESVDLEYEGIDPADPDYPTRNEAELDEDFAQRVQEWENERLQEWIAEKVSEIEGLDPGL